MLLKCPDFFDKIPGTIQHDPKTGEVIFPEGTSEKLKKKHFAWLENCREERDRTISIIK